MLDTMRGRLTFLVEAIAAIAVNSHQGTASVSTTAIRSGELGVATPVKGNVPHQALSMNGSEYGIEIFKEVNRTDFELRSMLPIHLRFPLVLVFGQSIAPRHTDCPCTTVKMLSTKYNNEDTWAYFEIAPPVRANRSSALRKVDFLHSDKDV